ncbi:MAG: hypothetical protein J0H83_17115 [Candidatus Melainabacteria bacterium]|jgi:hypothetical protein|nr:hypothetical protein [Candidatus Melainabacteria bacterium]
MYKPLKIPPAFLIIVLIITAADVVMRSIAFSRGPKHMGEAAVLLAFMFFGSALCVFIWTVYKVEILDYLRRIFGKKH